MESKYYTPEIEEFHVGFEYEINLEPIKGVLAEEDSGEEWEKVKMHKPLLLEAELELGLLRVKYLDLEDIESFKFKFENTDNFGAKVFRATKEVGFNTGTIYTIKLGQHSGCIISAQTYGSYGTDYNEIQFKIKNKSELRRILKQIGYEQ